MKYKFKRKWRHFKFWLVRKLFPSGDLSFLEEPRLLDLSLKQISFERPYPIDQYKFVGENHIKEVIVNSMMQNLINHLEYETYLDGEYIKCKGTLTLAERTFV